MAKQSGLHQIRGKVGEHSYYRQTGVSSGLIRSINQGMSQRVKDDEAFINTRLNNAEFGQAGRIAGVLGQLVTPKFRPMVLPFSQSKMARVVLDFIKTNSGAWGQRNIEGSFGEQVVPALNAVVKGNFDNTGLEVTLTQPDDAPPTVNIQATDEFVSWLSSIGADAAYVSVSSCSPWIGTFSTTTQKYAQSFARAILESHTFSEASAWDSELVFRPAPPTGWPAIETRFVVIVVIPYRAIEGKRHALQEHCTFRAFEAPQPIE